MIPFIVIAVMGAVAIVANPSHPKAANPPAAFAQELNQIDRDIAGEKGK